MDATKRCATIDIILRAKPLCESPLILALSKALEGGTLQKIAKCEFIQHIQHIFIALVLGHTANFDGRLQRMTHTTHVNNRRELQAEGALSAEGAYNMKLVTRDQAC